MIKFFMLKLYVFCPNSEEIINKIIEAATMEGAGMIGNYSHCAFYTVGMGNWKPLEGAHPTVGKVGEISHEPEVRIEMLCPEDKAKTVEVAIKSVHPYETAVVDFVKLVEINGIASSPK